MVTEAELEPGWLAREMADVEALQRAYKKIIETSKWARCNGYTQSCQVEFTIPELRALAYMAREAHL